MVNIVTGPDGRTAVVSDMPIQGSWLHVSNLYKLLMESEDPFFAELRKDPAKPAAVANLEACLRKRLDHCLRRLRQKNVWKPTCLDIYDSLVKSEDPVARSKAHMYLLGIDPRQEGLFDAEIPDEVWWMAMDMTMLDKEEAIYSDAYAMYTPAIYRHETELYFNVLQFLFGRALMDNLNIVNNHKDKTAGRMAELERANAALTAELDAARRALPDAEAIKSSASALRSDFDAYRRDFEKERLGYLRRIRKLESAAEDGSNKAKVQDAPEPENQPKAAARPALRHELPGEGIVFAGGDHNLLKKLALLYPDWTFIETNNANFPRQPGVRAIFLWSTQMSHAVGMRLDAQYGPDIPRLYVTRTNVAALSEEMADRWSEWVEKNAAP